MAKCSNKKCDACDMCIKEDLDYFKEQVAGIIDFIRWNELIFLVLSFSLAIFFLGWWGILVAFILDRLNHLDGGIMADLDGEFYQAPIKLPCSENIKDCDFCGNGYDHKFNVQYEQGLKWYERLI